MISKIKYIVLIFLLALMYACASDFDEVYIDDQIVVDGVLVPGEKAVIRLSELNELNDTTQIPIPDAIVSINFHNQRYTLDLTNENLGEYTFNGSGLEVLAGETFILEIEYYGIILSAQTTIPYPVEDVELEIFTDDLDSLGYGVVNYIDVNWNSRDNSYFYTTLECDSLNIGLGYDCNYYCSQLFPFFEEYQYIHTENLVTGNYYKLIIYSMTEEYAQYYYGSNDFGYSGNIENGYGIFTGLSSTSITFQYFTDSVSIVGK